jgi:hypothetical protein
MPKPLNVDWPAVRVLAVAVGGPRSGASNGDQPGRGATTLETRRPDGFP